MSHDPIITAKALEALKLLDTEDRHFVEAHIRQQVRREETRRLVWRTAAFGVAAVGLSWLIYLGGGWTLRAHTESLEATELRVENTRLRRICVERLLLPGPDAL